MSRQRTPLGRFAKEDTCSDKPCQRCGAIFRANKNKKFFCSAKCRTAADRYIDQAGYVCIKRPDHPRATTNGWVREHVVVATEALGRPLAPGEEVHHKDGNKQNNVPGNLEVMTKAAHARLHHGRPGNRAEGELNPLILCACGCGQCVEKYDERGRPRRYIFAHNTGRRR